MLWRSMRIIAESSTIITRMSAMVLPESAATGGR
jgi:hypothetical protein